MDPLITVGELADYLQRPVDPARGPLVVAGASAAVRAHCRWDLSYDPAATFTVDGNETRVLNLPTLNLIAVDEVRVNGVALLDSEFRWARRGQLFRDAGWSRWQQIDVDCEHGYAPAPDVVRIVALGLAARYLSNPESLKIATVGSVQRTYNDLTSLDLSLLDAYRLP